MYWYCNGYNCILGNMVMINVFIGYDSKEKVAFSVLAYSILRNSTKPVQSHQFIYQISKMIL